MLQCIGKSSLRLGNNEDSSKVVPDELLQEVNPLGKNCGQHS